ncbi:MAG: hypothetical protein H7099_04435 [Gemmatimonadaceae bacterium]|nr:hypothetical protein [Gemmatimonadaceae bacterium]
MSERKAFLLRVDPALLESMQRWANDDLRSLNAQIEFVLRRALQREARLIGPTRPPTDVRSDAGSNAGSDAGASAGADMDAVTDVG